MSWKLGLCAVFFYISLLNPFAHAETLSLAIIGDAGKYTSNTRSVQQSIERSGIKQLILPGDNLYTGSYAQQWSPWKGFEFSVVAIGNHNAGYQNEIKFFGMPGEYFETEIKGIRFLVLNSDNTRTVDEQAIWLENRLEDPKKVNRPTFLVWHHPPYTVTSFHSWREKTAFQNRMRPLLKTYGDRISGLLVGHDHIGAVYCIDRMPMIVSGAIWDTRNPEQKSYKDGTDGTQVVPQWIYPLDTPVWGRLDVDSTSGMSSIQFIRAADDKVLFQSSLGLAEQKDLCV